MGQIGRIEDGHTRNSKNRFRAKHEVSHYSGRQAGHKGWQHDKGGKVFMDDFHRKKAACHRRIEGGGKSGPAPLLMRALVSTLELRKSLPMP